VKTTRRKMKILRMSTMMPKMMDAIIELIGGIDQQDDFWKKCFGSSLMG